MTRNKHLKAAVRARMQRTGERYAAARRHVVATTLPRTDVVPGYPAFGGDRHHDSGLLTHVLAAAGVVTAHDGRPLDEPAVAGLAGGVGFMYFSFSYEGHLPTMTIVPRIHPRPFLRGALERAGVPHRLLETGSASKAAKELDAALAAGRAPVCTVDRPSLGYHPEAAAYAGNDPYDVAVVGRRGDGAVLLDDECLDPVAVPGEVFAAARAAHRKSRHRMLVVDDGAAPVDLAAAARAAIAVTVHDLTEDVMANNFAGNFGLRGLAKWADAVADRRTKHGWARLYGSGAAHAHAMQRLYDCLTTEYSSPGAMRPLYADFLDQVAHLLDDPAAAREAADGYARAGALWSQIADTATGGPLRPYRDLVERRLELLLDRGADAAEELASVVAEIAAFTRDLQLSDDERATQLDAVAELAGRVLEVEREACAALTQVAAA
jgi:Butirosin biosynthesis protein H, N-terminal/Domain of unknown function (DUF4872)